MIKLTTLLVLTTTASLSADFTIGSVPPNAPTGFTVFTKHVDVLGLHVFAKSNVSNSRVLHCANILAQWIDNNEDGDCVLTCTDLGTDDFDSDDICDDVDNCPSDSNFDQADTDNDDVGDVCDT